MTHIPGIVITGASGRMGQMLIKTVTDSDQARLVGVVERAGHDWIGQDVGTAMGGPALGVTVTDDPLEAFAQAQAVIDFTAPEATLEFAALAAQARCVHVIGTTGMTDEQIAALEPAARHAVIVRAGNMSLGVNLLVQLTKKVAAALDEDFDIEVIEGHHHHKVDAPSGTALMLGEAAAEGRGCQSGGRVRPGPRRHHRRASTRQYRLPRHSRRRHRWRARRPVCRPRRTHRPAPSGHRPRHLCPRRAEGGAVGSGEGPRSI